MKITKEVIKEFIVEVAGDDLSPLVDLLWKRTNVSEFKLAENLNITVNQVRNMLYRLSHLNLVSFMRRKDKKKGWYIYYWTLEDKLVKDELVLFWEKKLKQFKERLQREQLNDYYVCPNHCVRLSYAQAMEQDFHCLECGSLLDRQDNVRTIENLKNRIQEMEDELEEVYEERRKQEKRRIAHLKRKEEKVRQEKLAKRREAAEKRRKETARKKAEEEKKKPKKKTVKKKVIKKKTKKKAIKKKPSKKKAKKKVAKKKKPKPKKKIAKKKAIKKKATKKSTSKKSIKKKPKKKTSKKSIKKKSTKKKAKKKVTKKKKR